jgi:hypothetical protein
LPSPEVRSPAGPADLLAGRVQQDEGDGHVGVGVIGGDEQRMFLGVEGRLRDHDVVQLAGPDSDGERLPAVVPTLSVTWAVNVLVPAVAGVPSTQASWVLASCRLSPAGR